MDAALEAVKARLRERLNQTIDQLAYENGMTREDLLQTAQDFLKDPQAFKAKHDARNAKKDDTP